MIKMFITDVDGCLTDNGYIVDEGGTLSKRFNTRDFHGMEMLIDSGVEIGIVTRAEDDIITKRVYAAGIDADIVIGTKDKLQSVDRMITGTYQWDEIAYIGDDIPDIPLLKKVGYAACPRDALPAVRDILLRRNDAMLLSQRGGYGCVREFADMIININPSMNDRSV